MENNKFGVQKWSYLGMQILSQKETGCMLVGMSLDNSYFSKENIMNILRYCQDCDLPTYILIPDEPMIYSYLARGYDLAKAKRKVKAQSNALYNKISQCLITLKQERDSVSVKDEYDYDEFMVKIISISEYVNTYNIHYREAVSLVNLEYFANAQFQNLVNLHAREYLGNHNIVPGDKNYEIFNAATFLKLELAWILFASKFYNHKTGVYIYHKENSLIEYVCEIYGRFYKARPLAYVVVS